MCTPELMNFGNVLGGNLLIKNLCCKFSSLFRLYLTMKKCQTRKHKRQHVTGILQYVFSKLEGKRPFETNPFWSTQAFLTETKSLKAEDVGLETNLVLCCQCTTAVLILMHETRHLVVLIYRPQVGVTFCLDYQLQHFASG